MPDQLTNGATVQPLDPKKGTREILEAEITEGLRQISRPVGGLLISGFSAGLDVGFSVFLMGAMLTLSDSHVPHMAREILVANMYAVGFIFVILGRSELFTEHTTTAVLPVLHGRASLRQLGRCWGVIILANVGGGFISAALSTIVGPALGVIRPDAFETIALGLLHHPGKVIFLSAVMAGWMMGLLSWLVTAARDTISQIFFVWLVTTAIGLLHFHHSIAGTVEVLAGAFVSPRIGALDYARFMLWTVPGNAVGAVFFVAIIKYAHGIRQAAEPARVKLEEPGEGHGGLLLGD